MPPAIDDLNINYNPHSQDFYTSNPQYAGPPPNPTIEEAWRNLLQPMDIRVTATELARNNRVSVSLPEGGGYLAWLGGFHELHCVVIAKLPPYSKGLWMGSQYTNIICVNRNYSANGNTKTTTIRT